MLSAGFVYTDLLPYMHINSLLIFLLLSLTSCSLKYGNQQNNVFIIPAVTQPTYIARKNPAPRLADSISGVYPRLAGRFSFASSVALNKPDSLGNHDYFDSYQSYKPLMDADTLGTDGLELVADYHSNVVYQEPDSVSASIAKLFSPRRTYPVYLANSTPRTKLLYGKNSWVFAIQEAKDRDGQWRPIESKGFDFCGNGHWIMKIRAGQMAVFLMDKYQGTFNTLLRVRLQNGESRYISAPFAGKINESQFLVSRREHRILEEDKSAVDGMYYGATPAAVDSIQLREDLADIK